MTPRIVTLTVNPALDIAMQANEVRPGHKIRTRDATYDPGGGGVNVSRVIHALGGDTLAILAIGGSTGRFVEEMLIDAGVPCRAVAVRGTTRVSLTVQEISSGAEYRFVPEGGVLPPADAERFLSLLGDIRADWLVASGSLPPGFPADFYARVAHLARHRGMCFGLDTSGAALAAALHQGIDLLKTSLGEFESIAGARTLDVDELAQEASRLAAAGAAAMIALTLGDRGAILAAPADRWSLRAIAVRARGSVGAGDSFLAGLVLGLARRQPPCQALRLALATGAAAVMGQGTARVEARQVEALLADGPVSPDAGQGRRPTPVRCHGPIKHGDSP
jgi:6-phosphofructokinase 2